ncbi:MAG: hypothetical protein WCC60_09565 [Ilumatobacteraceae bacterium]
MMSEWEVAMWHAVWMVAVEEEAQRAALWGDDVPPRAPPITADSVSVPRPMAGAEATVRSA